MGSASKARERLYINTRRLRGRTFPCGPEMMATLACLKKAGFDDTRCQAEKKALADCVAVQAKKPKEVNTINYHLQRLNKATQRK